MRWLLVLAVTLALQAAVLTESVSINTDLQGDSPHQSDGSKLKDSIQVFDPNITFAIQEVDYVVQTPSGRIQGYPLSHPYSDIIGYYDIPYGKVIRRYSEPDIADPWQEVHAVSQHQIKCPQDYTEGSHVEDCLTLSIFKPVDAMNSSVLFHIHDGDFRTGSGDPAIYGPQYLVPKGIILVLPNYRLGPPGFLCLRNVTAAGNAGLKDLSLALSWVKDYIKEFGGNPHNVVVSGNGASAALVEYLALSPKSSKYFHKAITESGSALSHWAFDRHPIDTAAILAEKLREQDEDAPKDATIFKYTDIDRIISAAAGMTFRPCLEMKHTFEFISSSPWTLLHRDNNKISFIMGTTSHAGLTAALEANITKLNDQFDHMLPDDLEFEHGKEQRAEIGATLKYQYFGDSEITPSDMDKISMLFTDAWYLSPAIRSARPLVKAGATVYFYEFGFAGDRNQVEQKSEEPMINGAMRGDAMTYVFHNEGQTPQEGSKEELMVKMMTDMWLNFIEFGAPTTDNVNWTSLQNTEDSHETWVSITDPEENCVTPQKGIYLDRLRLWTEIYENHFLERNRSSHRRPDYYSTALVLFVLYGLYRTTL